MMGGALGLAVLASAAASQTNHLLASGQSHAAALLGGYHLAYLLGSAFALIASGLTIALLRGPVGSVGGRRTVRTRVRLRAAPPLPSFPGSRS